MRSLFSWDVTPGMFDDKEIHVVYSQISQSGLNQDVFFAVLLVVSTDSKIEDKHIADVVSEAFATPTSIYHSVGQKYLMSGHFYFILFFFWGGGVRLKSNKNKDKTAGTWRSPLTYICR